MGGALGALEAALRRGGLPPPGDGPGGGSAAGGVGGGAQKLARIVGDGGGAAAAAAAAGPADDARTLPILIGDDGVRFWEFCEGARMLQESAWSDWPVRGPRTVRWVPAFMRDRAGIPTAHRTRWRTMCRLQPQDAGVSLHECACRCLELLVTYDQVDVTNIAGAEILSRQVQLVEEKWKDCVFGSPPTGDIEHDSHLYLGTGMSRGDLCVGPLLQAWIAEQLSAESAILKERRKAREERTLTRGGGGGGGGGGGHNHGDGKKGCKKKADDKKCNARLE